MTFQPRPESPRRIGARQFGQELVIAQEKRKISTRHLASVTGIGRTLLVQYRLGNSCPRVAQASVLAETLDWDRLRRIAERARTAVCGRPTCGRTFVNEGTRKTYCTERCRTLHEKGRGDPRTRAFNAERDLTDAKACVDAMCRSCEPEGTCRTPQCALRPISPLPLIRTTRDVALATPLPGVDFRTGAGASWATPAAREATLAGIRDANAKRWARPGERERFAEQSRQLHAEGRIPPRGHGRKSKEGKARAAASSPETNASEFDSTAP
jgi:hypothetical protein